MTSNVRAYNIGCEPSPSVPAETLLQDGWKTYLLFLAVSKDVGDDGYLKDLGVAILDCVNASSTIMGYPNDEGRPEHPLWNQGLSSAETSILEVINSVWLTEKQREMKDSSIRIWGGRGIQLPQSESAARHFVVTLKETTFECIAERLVVVHFAATYAAAFDYVIAKFNEH